MSRFIDVVESFEIRAMKAQTYREKIVGLLESFPKFERDERYRIVLPHKNPKAADDYVSMKFCLRGRPPVYGIYNRRDLELIAVCVKGILYAIDDCDLDPNLVPDLAYVRLNLGIGQSSLLVSKNLSYTKSAMCAAVSMLSLGYTPGKKDEWTDAVVLLTGMTTQAVRLSVMLDHVNSGFYEMADIYNVPHVSVLSLQANWSKISKAIREDKLPYLFEYYDYDEDGKINICRGQVTSCGTGYELRLIDDADRTEEKKVRRRNVDSNGQREGSKTKINYKESTGQAAPVLGANRKLEIEKNKSLEICGTSESAYLGMLGVFRWTLAAAALGARQKLNVKKFKSSESCGISESAYTGMSDVFRKTLAAAASSATQKVSTSMKDMCFDQFGMSKEKIDSKMVKGNQEPGELLQFGCEPISPLQDIMARMEAQHSNTNALHPLLSNVFRRTLPHEGLKGFQKGLLPNLLKAFSSARTSTKLNAAISVVAKGLLSTK